MNTRFPTLQEALDIHTLLIHEFGGSLGLRDIGALESALIRPQLGYYKDLIGEAAALMESLAMNHPFIDGNKRIAFFLTDTFLRMNGKFIDCDNIKTYEFLMDLFMTDNFEFHTLELWLKEKAKPL